MLGPKKIGAKVTMSTSVAAVLTYVSCGVLMLCPGCVLAADDDTFEDAPEVVIGQSTTIRGTHKKWDGKSYWSFRGIRFGAPPVGRDRFRSPTTVELPPLVVAENYGNSCQPLGGGLTKEVYDEDCLFLNVFCPPLVKGAQPKAVIVYIHGGGNIFGTAVGRDGASLVVHRDVITVTINYRLGPLGFLSTEDTVVPGNAGLFDQAVAIRWTRQNIQHFGGDPYRITLMGDSAGGVSACLHSVSPYTKGLVQRAIMLGGTAFAPAFYAWAPTKAARILAGRVHCPTETSSAMVKCLQKVKVADLMREAMNLWPHDNVRTVLDFWWGAVRDNDFVPASLEPGMFRGDVLLSNNNNDGSSFQTMRMPMVKKNDPNWAELLTKDFFKSVFINQSLYQYFLKYPDQNLIEETFKTYIGSTPTKSEQVDVDILMDFYADQQFIFPSIDYLDQRINTGSSYLYYFDRFLKMYKDEPSYLQGSHHTDDKPFILGHDYDRYTYSGPQRYIEDKVAEGLQIYVTNFAKTGDPNKPIPPPVHFSPYHDPRRPRGYLHVTGNTDKSDPHSLFEGMKSNLLSDRMELWSKKLAPTLRGKDVGNKAADLSIHVVIPLVCLLVVVTNIHHMTSY